MGIKVTILVPITVEADIESYSDENEGAFNVNHTDFIRLMNIKAPTNLTLAAQHVTIPSEE